MNTYPVASALTDAASEVALLERIRAGDAVALSTVYRRHGAAVFRFAALHAPTREAAADATQETFLWLASNGAAGFEPERSSLAAFLCGVARNHALRIRSKEARYTPLADEKDGDTGQPDSDAGDALSHLLVSERGEALLRALATLPAGHREIIALVEFEDYSYAEAAEIIGCPIGTVRSRLSRAKRGLHERVMELFPALKRIPE